MGLEQVLNHFCKYRMTILLSAFNAKLGRGNVFKPTFGNENIHQDINAYGVRMVNFVTLKIQVVKSMMFPHRNILKCTWTTSDGKTLNHIEHILTDRRWH